ncbi:hypothetical protein ACWGBH_22655 [Streptomyces massasporeus]
MVPVENATEKGRPALADAVREVTALGGPRRTIRQPASEQGPQS